MDARNAQAHKNLLLKNIEEYCSKRPRPFAQTCQKVQYCWSSRVPGTF
jgi:hypothetical protein